MDPAHSPRYHLTYRPHHGSDRQVGGVLAGLLAAARAFEDEFFRLACAGERGTLTLVCELAGTDVPIVARRVAPGTAD